MRNNLENVNSAAEKHVAKTRAKILFEACSEMSGYTPGHVLEYVSAHVPEHGSEKVLGRAYDEYAVRLQPHTG